MNDKNYCTDQEKFWSGDFGTSYINRNQAGSLLQSNIHFFKRSLKKADNVSSCIEFGANIGMNLKALKELYSDIHLEGIEINADAAARLKQVIGVANVHNTSIQEWKCERQADLCLVKGVLIHIHPDSLEDVYRKLYVCSNQYILICEYYNPTPVMIPYRGHKDRLFKRDFAGEMLDQYNDLSLLDYGFFYHRDNLCPQDDITWFLLQKT